MSQKPKVTVLMPVYNGEKYLKEAIESILNQTFSDFEFLIINDGSTDRSREIVLSCNDSRIILVDNEKNLGLTCSLNKGLALAKGEYIARMDADDISLNERLARQVAFMDSNPMVGVCGTWMKIFGNEQEVILQLPTDYAEIKCKLLFDSVLAHPTVIMRRKLLESHGLMYDERVKHVEDYDLWVRCAQHFPLKNIDEVLHLYRLHPKQIGKVYADTQQEWADVIRWRQLIALGISPNELESSIHRYISRGGYEFTQGFFVNAEAWLVKLLDANKEIGYYDHPVFEQIIEEKWFGFCNEATKWGLWSWKIFCQSSLSRRCSRRQKIRFGINCLFNSK